MKKHVFKLLIKGMAIGLISTTMLTACGDNSWFGKKESVVNGPKRAPAYNQQTQSDLAARSQGFSPAPYSSTVPPAVQQVTPAAAMPSEADMMENPYDSYPAPAPVTAAPSAPQAGGGFFSRWFGSDEVPEQPRKMPNENVGATAGGAPVIVPVDSYPELSSVPPTPPVVDEFKTDKAHTQQKFDEMVNEHFEAEKRKQQLVQEPTDMVVASPAVPAPVAAEMPAALPDAPPAVAVMPPPPQPEVVAEVRKMPWEQQAPAPVIVPEPVAAPVVMPAPMPVAAAAPAPITLIPPPPPVVEAFAAPNVMLKPPSPVGASGRYLPDSRYGARRMHVRRAQ